MLDIFKVRFPVNFLSNRGAVALMFTVDDNEYHVQILNALVEGHVIRRWWLFNCFVDMLYSKFVVAILQFVVVCCWCLFIPPFILLVYIWKKVHEVHDMETTRTKNTIKTLQYKQIQIQIRKIHAMKHSKTLLKF